MASSWSREARPWPWPEHTDQAGTESPGACPSHQALGGQCQGGGGAQALTGDMVQRMPGDFQSNPLGSVKMSVSPHTLPPSGGSGRFLSLDPGGNLTVGEEEPMCLKHPKCSRTAALTIVNCYNHKSKRLLANSTHWSSFNLQTI